MPGSLLDPVTDRIIHLLHRAEEARAIAQEMHEPTCRSLLELIAEDFEAMAAEQRGKLLGN